MKSFFMTKTFFFVSLFLVGWRNVSSGFSLLFMARKGQGKLKEALTVVSDATVSKTKASLSLAKTKGQEIRGVTLPIEVREFYILFVVPII